MAFNVFLFFLRSSVCARRSTRVSERWAPQLWITHDKKAHGISQETMIKKNELTLARSHAYLRSALPNVWTSNTYEQCMQQSPTHSYLQNMRAAVARPMMGQMAPPGLPALKMERSEQPAESRSENINKGQLPARRELTSSCSWERELYPGSTANDTKCAVNGARNPRRSSDTPRPR